MVRPFVKGFTIDPGSTWMYEDAIWANRTPDGHISDVTIVDPTQCGDEASRQIIERDEFRQGKQKPWRIIEPDMARKLALSPGKRRAGFTASIPFGKHGRQSGRASIELTRIKSSASFSYEEVSLAIQDADAPLHQELAIAEWLSRKIHARRARSSHTGLTQGPDGSVTDKQGVVKELAEPDRAGYITVAAMMEIFNEEVTLFGNKEGIPLLYMNHLAERDPSTVNLVRELRDDVSAPHPMQIGLVIRHLGLHAQRVRYGVEPAGHHAMGLPMIANMTAPFRRTHAFVNAHNTVSYLRGKSFLFPTSDLIKVANTLNRGSKRKAKRLARAKLWTPQEAYKNKPEVLLAIWAMNVGLAQPHYSMRRTRIQGKLWYRCMCHFYGYSLGVVWSSPSGAKRLVAKAICEDLSIG